MTLDVHLTQPTTRACRMRPSFSSLRASESEQTTSAPYDYNARAPRGIQESLPNNR
jgi:hypothetical protein